MRFKTIQYMRLALIISISILSYGCFEHRTTNPDKAYKYWAGEKPPKEIKVIKAQYWQSAHWSKEYIMFLELVAPDKWWNEFKSENALIEDTGKWSAPTDSPQWFKPSTKFKTWKLNDDTNPNSSYFRDSKSDTIYIYEIQL